ncbi:MAG TPA: helix-turn-helix domain-containing protein [Xanthobacteraceae bacterium]|jgi:Ner family transcriptional regulator|nr:helix-turn-helix domain-containing protein [Xanthobacteraceae bacterium]HQS46815.1 helix-turn-helix domain-containing protein [Xanthobacteraceae bacterium]
MTKPAPVVMDRHEIRAEVHRRETTLTAIAVAANLNPSACRSALVRRHLAGEQALAAFLGVPPEKIWPERYAKPSPWAKRILSERSRASQNDGQATDMGAAA